MSPPTTPPPSARFGGDPVDVIGHSTGGSIVLQLIADHPEVVRRAVVASAAYRLGPVAKRAQREMARRLSSGRPGFHLLAPGFTKSPVLIRLIAAAMWTAGLFVRVRDPADLNAMTGAEDAFDVHDRLPDITTPTLVVHGGRDYFWTPEMFADTARRMPYGRLLTYPAVGHGVNVHRRFFADVIAFLRDGGSRPEG
jgi:pimeloyl-ACP methyl ester carboxylesterase